MIITSDLDLIQLAFDNEEVFIYPTEGVYGLGCNPKSDQAISQLLSIKKRSPDKGLILIANNVELLYPYIHINQSIENKLNDLSYQFITCLVPKSYNCPHLLSGKHDTIAIRLTRHPVVSRLCEHLNSPLVSTSANIANKPTIQNFKEACKVFRDTINIFVDGSLGNANKPSQIISLIDEQQHIIRH